MADREGTEGTTWNALNSKRVFVSAEAAREGREGKTQPGGIFSRGLRLIKSFANLHTYTHSIRRAARSFATVGFGGRLCRDSYRYLRHPLQSGTLPVINRDLTCFFFFFSVHFMSNNTRRGLPGIKPALRACNGQRKWRERENRTIF